MTPWVVATERDPVMKPVARNFRMTAGDAFSIQFKIIESDDAPTATVVDIAGALVVFRVWQRGCKTLAISKEVGSGIALTTPASGLLTVEFDESDTVDLTPGVYDWQLRLNLVGQPVVFVGGAFVLGALIGELQPSGPLLLDSDTLVL